MNGSLKLNFKMVSSATWLWRAMLGCRAGRRILHFICVGYIRKSVYSKDCETAVFDRFCEPLVRKRKMLQNDLHLLSWIASRFRPISPRR